MERYSLDLQREQRQLNSNCLTQGYLDLTYYLYSLSLLTCTTDGFYLARI